MCRKIIFLLLVFFLLCGCELTLSEPYKFRYGIDQITNIEILEQNPVYSSWDDRFFILILLRVLGWMFPAGGHIHPLQHQR